MFITITDLTKSIRAEILNEIIRLDETVAQIAIDSAIAEMKAYLSGAYDTGIIFEKQGAARNALLVDFAVDIAIYNIIEIERPGINSEDRYERYRRAIDWLKQVRDGKLTTDLPARQVVINTAVSYGSKKKRNNHY